MPQPDVSHDRSPRLGPLVLLSACVVALAAAGLASSIAEPATPSAGCTGKAVVSVIGSESGPVYA